MSSYISFFAVIYKKKKKFNGRSRGLAWIAEEEELKNRVTSSLFVEQKWKAL